MIALAAAAANAFNLTCTITSMGLGGDIPKRVERPFTAEFRVDLAAKRYCEGDCRSTMPVAKVTDSDIFLKLTDQPRLKEFLRINRESGDMIMQWKLGDGGESIEAGSCTPSAFTGFPVRRF